MPAAFAGLRGQCADNVLPFAAAQHQHPSFTQGSGIGEEWRPGPEAVPIGNGFKGWVQGWALP